MQRSNSTHMRSLFIYTLGGFLFPSLQMDTRSCPCYNYPSQVQAIVPTINNSPSEPDCQYHQILTRTLFYLPVHKIKFQSRTLHPPGPQPSTSNMAIDKATQTTPPGSPRPHTTTRATTTDSLQPKRPTACETCSCTPKPVVPHPSTAITLHGSAHETTTTTDQSTTPAAPRFLPQSLPQFMRSTWTAEEITQLDQLRSQGLPWAEVSTHFLGKTGNACRKRHERHKKGTLRRAGQ